MITVHMNCYCSPHVKDPVWPDQCCYMQTVVLFTSHCLHYKSLQQDFPSVLPTLLSIMYFKPDII